LLIANAVVKSISLEAEQNQDPGESGGSWAGVTWNDKGHRLFAELKRFVGGHLCTAADLSVYTGGAIRCAEMRGGMREAFDDF